MADHLKKRVMLSWILLSALLVYLMVFVGGMTRLTDSGLSMVEWRPLMGTLPPLHTDEWNRVFELYKATPEYQQVNHHFTLEEFKSIFYWEYGHRLLGRLVGLIFFFPLLFFHLKGWLKLFKPKASLYLWIGFFLGGSQGVLGWYMVKSGLVDRTDVSHYRLAAHFLLALLILSYLFWLYLKFSEKPQNYVPKLKKLTIGFLGLITVQLAYGAFMAGLKAGYGFNDFPLMAGQFFPSHIFDLKPLWINFVENNIAVQFIHRSLGWLILFYSFLMIYIGFKERPTRRIKVGLISLGLITVTQFLLGVSTLILVVPLPLALAHQIGAVLLLLTTLAILFSTLKSQEKSAL